MKYDDEVIKVAKLQEELEQERVRLAGCLCIAEGHIDETVKQGVYGWSLPYERIRELQKELATLKNSNEQLKSWVNDHPEIKKLKAELSNYEFLSQFTPEQCRYLESNQKKLQQENAHLQELLSEERLIKLLDDRPIRAWVIELADYYDAKIPGKMAHDLAKAIAKVKE